MTLKKFLIMVGSDVAGEIVFDEAFPQNKKAYAALLDKVEVVEVQTDTNVEKGYTWNGTTCLPSEEKEDV